MLMMIVMETGTGDGVHGGDIVCTDDVGDTIMLLMEFMVVLLAMSDVL